MSKRKSEARLRWEVEYREQRRQATWERIEDWLARACLLELCRRSMTRDGYRTIGQALNTVRD